MSDDLEMTALQSVTTDELIVELMARSESMVLAFTPKCQSNLFDVRYGGTVIGTVGLAEAALVAVKREMKKRMRD